MPAKHQVVVGVDFGTTFSGVSYCCTSLGNTNPRRPEIHTINNGAKIPTKLCYCLGNKGGGAIGIKADKEVLKDAGEEIERGGRTTCRSSTGDQSGLSGYDHPSLKIRTSSYKPQGEDAGLRYIWGDICDCNNPITAFKLTLDNDIREYAQLNNLLIPPNNLVIDYLSALREYFELDLSTRFEAFKRNPDDFEFDWTIAIPAFLDQQMVDRFKDILQQAGFRGSVQSLSEPEAGMMYAIHKNATSLSPDNGFVSDVLSNSSGSPRWSPPELLQPGSRIIVCDAGGGTTDLEAVEILSISDDNDSMPVIKLHPLQWTNGQQVGSINIEQDFARDIISRLRAIGLWSRPDQEPPVLQGEVVSMEKFVTWKEKFDGRMLERFLPLFADQAWRGDFPDVGINGGYIKLDSTQMERYFSEVLEKLRNLAENYLDSLERRRADIQGILFIGGLSASPYIQAKLKAWAQTRRVETIFPPTSRDAAVAVMRGAVLSRLQQLYDECSPTTAFIARSSFGIVLDVPYISYKHEYGPNYEHTITGEKMVKDQVEWLVKKGDEIVFNKSNKRELIRHELFVKGDRKIWTYKLVRCDITNVQGIPTTANDPRVIDICEETLDLTHISSKNTRYFIRHKKSGGQFTRSSKYYEVELHVKLDFTSATELNYEVFPQISPDGFSREVRGPGVFRWIRGRFYR